MTLLIKKEQGKAEVKSRIGNPNNDAVLSLQLIIVQ